MTTITNILLVDDHPMLRKGLRLLIELEEGLNVIGEANDGQEAIERVRELAPDIVVMDINMPNLNGVDATRQILAESPQIKVLVLSINSSKQYVESMLEAGVIGYLLKESAPEELIKALHVISKGKSYLSADISDIVLSRLRQVMVTEEASNAETQRLISKLQRPELLITNLHRAQLIQQLQAGCEKKMTLLAAPVGYGKTTLVSDWLTQSDTPSAWLTIDKDDNNLRLFLKSLLASIRTLLPGACPNLQSLTNAANLPPVSTLSADLINDFEQCPQHFILVMDDYQLIEDKSVNDLMSQLLKHPLRQLHLVLMSSRDPFLPLQFLRTNNEINELRTDVLSFSLQETTLFLERMLRQKIDPETASDWRERTDGQVASLQRLQLAKTVVQLPGKVDGYGPESDITSETTEDLSDWRKILTNREYHVLRLLQQRLSDKEIAKQLYISTDTVKSHTKKIREKLNVSSRRAAVSQGKDSFACGSRRSGPFPCSLPRVFPRPAGPAGYRPGSPSRKPLQTHIPHPFLSV